MNANMLTEAWIGIMWDLLTNRKDLMKYFILSKFIHAGRSMICATKKTASTIWRLQKALLL